VLLGGDIHQNYVCRVHADAARADSAVVASEFCGTSISSRSGTTQAKVDAIVRHNPHVLLARCDQRGYGLADITPTRWSTTLRVVDDPLRADSGASTLARFVWKTAARGPRRPERAWRKPPGPGAPCHYAVQGLRGGRRTAADGR